MHCGSCRASVWCATAALANPVTQTSFARSSAKGSLMHTTETMRGWNHRQHRYLTTWRNSEKYWSRVMVHRQTREHQREEQAGKSRTANGSWCQLRLTRALRWPISGVTGEMVSTTPQVPAARTVERSGQTLRELRHGTEGLLTSLALGEVAECPFPSDEVKNLKAEVVRCAEANGYELRREAADRINAPIDFRFLQLLLTWREIQKFTGAISP